MVYDATGKKQTKYHSAFFWWRELRKSILYMWYEDIEKYANKNFDFIASYTDKIYLNSFRFIWVPVAIISMANKSNFF